MAAKIPVTRRQLRLWGAQTGGALLVLGVLVFGWRGEGWGRVPLLLGALFAILGLSALPPARPLYRGWHLLVGAVLWLWTRLALILTYMLAVTPISLLGLLVGRDRLHLKFPGGQESYWREQERDGSSNRYRRQF